VAPDGFADGPARPVSSKCTLFPGGYTGRGVRLRGVSVIGAWRRFFFERSIMKRTYQPSKIRRARTHGFLVRMKTRGGKAVIRNRRAKGRKRLGL